MSATVFCSNTSEVNMQVHVLSMPLSITKKVTTVGAMKYEEIFNFKTY